MQSSLKELEKKIKLKLRKLVKKMREGEITSHPIWASIEPYRNHFRELLILPTTTSTTTFLVFKGNTRDDIGKSIKVMNL